MCAPIARIRDVDRTVAAVAQTKGGRYSVDLHLEHDRDASRAFAEAHVRRLEAMRRAGVTERLADGSWQIAEDHLERVAPFEARGLRDRPVAIEVLSSMPIERLAQMDGPTWLARSPATSLSSRAMRGSGGRFAAPLPHVGNGWSSRALPNPGAMAAHG